MSTHPNVILMAVITPDDLARKTMHDILEQYNSVSPTDPADTPSIKINGRDYWAIIMETTYDDGFQIAASEGDLIFFDLVTYGFGDVITWDELEKKKNALVEWAKGVCAQFHCKYDIRVSANYW